MWKPDATLVNSPSLTRDEVDNAIKKHLNPGAMVTVEAGSVPAAQALPK